jgi:hypothetical protein
LFHPEYFGARRQQTTVEANPIHFGELLRAFRTRQIEAWLMSAYPKANEVFRLRGHPFVSWQALVDQAALTAGAMASKV